MSTTTVIRITDAQPTIKLYQTNKPAALARWGVGNLSKYLYAVATGIRKATVVVQTDGTVAAKAVGTITLSGVVATDALTINGVAFTCVNSGATGNQFNKGADDTGSATNLAAKINASATALVTKVVTATSAGAVLTLNAFVPGLTGNCITVAQTGGHMTLAANCSGGRLTTGTGDDAAQITYNLL